MNSRRPMGDEGKGGKDNNVVRKYFLVLVEFNDR